MNVFASLFSDAMLDWRVSLVTYLGFGLLGGLGVAFLINFFYNRAPEKKKAHKDDKKAHEAEPEEA
jgi:putative Mn2+ efflux pump MntP